MKFYIVVDAENMVIGTGSFFHDDELPSFLDCAVHVVDSPVQNFVSEKKLKFENNQIIEIDLPTLPVAVEVLRARNYPSIGDQLDMIWHAMNNGELQKIEPFYSEIKAVKDAYPK